MDISTDTSHGANELAVIPVRRVETTSVDQQNVRWTRQEDDRNIWTSEWTCPLFPARK